MVKLCSFESPSDEPREDNARRGFQATLRIRLYVPLTVSTVGSLQDRGPRRRTQRNSAKMWPKVFNFHV